MPNNFNDLHNMVHGLTPVDIVATSSTPRYKTVSEERIAKIEKRVLEIEAVLLRNNLLATEQKTPTPTQQTENTFDNLQGVL